MESAILVGFLYLSPFQINHPLYWLSGTEPHWRSNRGMAPETLLQTIPKKPWGREQAAVCCMCVNRSKLWRSHTWSLWKGFTIIYHALLGQDHEEPVYFEDSHSRCDHHGHLSSSIEVSVYIMFVKDWNDMPESRGHTMILGIIFFCHNYLFLTKNANVCPEKDMC